MALKFLTKKHNQRMIVVYYALALIAALIGLFLKDTRWYIISVVFLFLAIFRKYFLMKRLKG